MERAKRKKFVRYAEGAELYSMGLTKCQTAHCGRCEQHFIVGAFTSPTVRFGR